jgi:hypothetical protein
MPGTTDFPARPRYPQRFGGCGICGPRKPAWRLWEPEVECWRHEASTAAAGANCTLNEERPRCVGGVALPHSEVTSDGARRVIDRTR